MVAGGMFAGVPPEPQKSDFAPLVSREIQVRSSCAFRPTKASPSQTAEMKGGRALCTNPVPFRAMGILARIVVPESFDSRVSSPWKGRKRSRIPRIPTPAPFD